MVGMLASKSLIRKESGVERGGGYLYLVFDKHSTEAVEELEGRDNVALD